MMANIVQETRIELANREVLALGCIEGHVLACQSGELWITLDGSREDIILGPGQSWQVTGNAPIVVSALKPSLLVTTDPRGRVPCIGSRARAESILTALLRWRHPGLSAIPVTMLR
ncbi:MAG: DUF2917 domain-containing protein [Sulfuritalea sp.]|nr:DUF2917 domain-containing protein [Sulfuritalea sp.]